MLHSTEWTFLLYVGTIENDFEWTPEELARTLAQIPECSFVNLVYELSAVDRTERGRIRLGLGGRNVEKLARLPPIDSPSTKAVASFVDWATETFPSRYTALIFKDHGGAQDRSRKKESARMKEGSHGVPARSWLVPGKLDIVQDGATGHYLSNRGLRRVLERTRAKRVDLYGFDACSMASLETAYEVCDVAAYMVATTNYLDVDVFPYAAALRLACQPGSAPPREIARILATTPTPSGRATTLMAIDLGWAAALSRKVDEVASASLPLLADREPFKKARKDLTDLEFGMVDLRQWLGGLQRVLPRDVPFQGKVDAAIGDYPGFCFAGTPVPTGPDLPPTGGAGVFFPRKADYSYWGLYGELRFARHNRWRQFIERYCFADEFL